MSRKGKALSRAPAAVPVPRWRRILYGLAPLLVLLAILETAALITDARTHYRARLLTRLALMEGDNQPVSGDVVLDWPAQTLAVRGPDRHPPTMAPYRIGGRLIHDAMLTPRPEFLSPESAVRSGERRIFVVGGSAAFGYPCSRKVTFAALLDSRLRAQGVRVLNAAQVGSSTGRLVPVVRRIIRHYRPDTIVIFAGNNEWSQWGPEKQGTSSAWRVRLLRFFAHSRAIAAVEYWSLGRALKPKEPAAVEESGFRRHFEISGSTHALRNPLDDSGFDPQRWLSDRERFLDVFESNLAQMIRMAREADVRVILLTVPFNYRLSPTWKHPQPWWFDAEHREELVSAHRDAGRLVAQGDFRSGLTQTTAALALDPRPPVLNYLKGQCLEGLGESKAAEEAYAQCREHMIGNLGSRLSINQSIARVARANAVTLIHVRRQFDIHGHARGRWFNADLIHDDCHPTPEGHRIIADALEKVLGGE